ncbi:MAG: hypothetical protein OEM63_08190, partial [Gammaproteobacteria bacterium]|nr:hypothetical protein [Gammaproteobacteria bacterium]
MLQSAQQVAIDLTRNTLQVSDSLTNSVGTSEPEGSFAALLQVPPPDDGAPASDLSGSELPVDGSELPADVSEVPAAEAAGPADTSLTEFIAFYEGASDPSLPATTADRFLADSGGDPADSTDMAGLVGIAAPPAVQSGRGLPIGEAGRDDGRTQLRTANDSRSSLRDHGRMPFAQPLAAPDRMIFKSAGQAGELTSGMDLTGAVTGREQALADAATASSERTNPGVRIQGQPLVEQGARAPGEPLATFELPVQKEGIDSAGKPSAAAPTVAAAGQLTDPTQFRDLAGTAKPTPVLATTINQPVMDEAWGEAFQ